MRKNKQGMSVGVVSLIMIFVVFLLVSLAVLSLTTASANARMADKSLPCRAPTMKLTPEPRKPWPR